MTTKIKLYCIPYAGGSAIIYHQWKSKLRSNIELCPIELAGRGGRITEPLYANLEAAVEDIFEQIKAGITTHDYIVFGHSMGALLAYELLQKIKNEGVKKPLHAFFSGRKPPHIARKKIYSSLSTEAFEREIMSLGGTPPEVFKYPELKEVFMPILRNDFRISETVIKRSEISKLPIEFSILIGKEEQIHQVEANQWRMHTSQACCVYFVNGGHFFLSKETDAVTNIINQSISKLIDKQKNEPS